MPDMVVTAHFEEADAGYFLRYDGDSLLEPFFQVGTSWPMSATKVEGWSNDPNEEILVEFTGKEQGFGRNDHVMIYTTYSEVKLVADLKEVKFDEGTTEKITNNASNAGVQTTYDADAYKIGFTMTDKAAHVKRGTILLKFNGHALVETEHGKVKFGETEYASGKAIPFKPGDEVTVYAVADEGYSLKQWNIEGVTSTSTEGDSVTFTVPDKFFSIKPVFEKDGDTPPGVVYATVIAEHGTLKYNNKEYADGGRIAFTPGAKVTVFAAAGEGYYLDTWSIPGADLKSRDPYDNSIVFIVPDVDFSIKPVFESTEGKVTLDFHAYNTGTDKDYPNSLGDNGWNGDYPFNVYLFSDKSLSIDEIVAKKNRNELDSYWKASYTGLTEKWPFYIEKGTGILFEANMYPGDGEYICESLASTAAKADQVGMVRYEDSQYRMQNSRLYIAFIANENVTVDAKFRSLAYHEIIVKSADETMGTVEITPEGNSGTIQKESTHVMLQAIPKEGYSFKRWIEENEGTPYLSEEQKTLSTALFEVKNTDATFTAEFEEAAESPLLPIAATTDPKDKATVVIKAKENETVVSTAKQGTYIVASLTGLDEYYEFDHWEITTGDDRALSLIREDECRDSSVEFLMPSVEQGVCVKAVLKERYNNFLCRILTQNSKNGNYSIDNSGAADAGITINGSSLSSNSAKIKKGDKISYSVTIENPSKYVLEKIEKRSSSTTEIYKESSGIFEVTDWGGVTLDVYLSLKEETPDVYHNITLKDSPNGKISASLKTAQQNTTITLTATPNNGYMLTKWVVRDANDMPVIVTADGNDRNIGTFKMPNSNVTVTAEFGPLVEPKIESIALLQGYRGKEIVQGELSLSGDKWTINIPDTILAEDVAKIPEGTSDFYLKIVTPSGVDVEQEGGYTGDWSDGSVFCCMPINREVSFQAISNAGTKNYTIKLVYAGLDEPSAPTLSDGSATRSSKTAATVTFTSNVAGTYYYKVVDHNAAAPTVDEIKKSTSGLANAGTATTITISNLTEDARDVYIVVVAADGESAPLKIEIPAYEPNPGKYTITVKAPKGGTITPSRTRANAGDEIIVTVTPDSGYQMVADSLTYTLAIKDGETVKITNNRFTMPEGNVTISCQWETAATTAKGITAFSINGVAGAVNNTTNTITITMPRGTDVTKLTPVIATNGVKSLTPGSGVTMDFTNAVTYTATMEDGSIKTYTVTVYVEKGTLSDQFWDKLTDFVNQIPWWEYAKHQQSTSSYPKYW